MKLLGRVTAWINSAPSTGITYAQHELRQALDNAAAVGALTDETLTDLLDTYDPPEADIVCCTHSEPCSICQAYYDQLRALNEGDHDDME